jgi:hypothetical protein
MRTRTLLLLAIACGVIILVAGGIQLVRLTDQQQTSVQLQTDERGEAGDVVVTLRAVSDEETPSGLRTVVSIDIGGVDDANGLDGFTLVGVGEVARVDATESTCAAITEVEQTCALAFDTSTFPGGARQLILRRAETQLRWVLPTV